MGEADCVDLENSSPSAKLVFKVLEYNGELTQQQIAEESFLPQRTVRDAISRLKDADIVSEETYLPDARKRVYTLNGCPSNRPD